MQHNTPLVCSVCEDLLPDTEISCPRPECQSDGSPPNEFLMFNIEDSLAQLFKDHHFCAELSRNFQQRDAACVSDIVNSQGHRRVSQVNASKWNLTLTLNTDGMTIFKVSRSGSLWPVYLTINELSPKSRFSLKYVIIYALWFKPSKPPVQAFFQPLMDQLMRLSTEGVKFQTAEGQQLCHARLTLVTCDLPARAMVSCMKQHNGICACIYCYHTGITVGDDHLHRYWPYNSTAACRTHESIIRDVLEAVQSKTAASAISLCLSVSTISLVSQVNGMHPVASPLLAAKGFNLVDGVAIDYMHVVCLGVTRNLLEKWLSDRSSAYFIGHKIQFLDKRLLSIAPADIIIRTPRTLKEFNTWKANELRSWLFYWSVPVLRGILPTEYYVHYCLLVAACRTLCGTTVSRDDINQARKFLQKFYDRHELLYGITACTMKVHLLQHLADCVEKWGSLWAYSTFWFESLNGILRRYVHGTRFVSNQIASAVTAIKAIPAMLPSIQQHMNQPEVLALADKFGLLEK
ncbi:uncharacterized protein LOC134194453 isoform X2 [Corticium candelabrum]|uniref:uncharacterized protein LOC134194453 isoform X2 n=1 Tax=Corticium candelabrum TaxID=121492 RepID=UPI002E275013|nr:uncharacterized protein LOC134194453 isoform X2 [Corticium candelabrum]